ncbi:PREDICTED: keratin-associated protein 4-7-like, partial [Elephantulus edwardii]|uniref:keratin-associated protein 4-7-like n=1 Tax=Elephantulus edwardii TaxID=28737 RepID=UPI0003F07873
SGCCQSNCCKPSCCQSSCCKPCCCQSSCCKPSCCSSGCGQSCSWLLEQGVKPSHSLPQPCLSDQPADGSLHLLLQQAWPTPNLNKDKQLVFEGPPHCWTWKTALVCEEDQG